MKKIPDLDKKVKRFVNRLYKKGDMATFEERCNRLYLALEIQKQKLLALKIEKITN